ncbi:MAG: GDP-mannose 4,6-dehydratase [Victivallaceae bacterium]
MKILINGGGGFLGSNLAAEALKRRDSIQIVDNLSRIGSEKNLIWLHSLGHFEFTRADVRDAAAIEAIIKASRPDVIFHLAGQVAMTTSIADPRTDFETNTMGSFNVLDAVRKHSPETAVLYSSTNKVYGDLEDIQYIEGEKRYMMPDYPNGFDEQLRLDFRSPYGCSKGAADQYMLDFHRVYGLRTAVFRHSSMFGGRQFATADQGWVGWFCQKGIEIASGQFAEPFTICGNGKQVRDVLVAEDMVDLYFKAVEAIDHISGNVFNIGGGGENSFSLLELFDFISNTLKIKINYTELPWRKSDQKVFIADIRKAQQMIGWAPQTDKYSGVLNMLEWVRKNG